MPTGSKDFELHIDHVAFLVESLETVLAHVSGPAGPIDEFPSEGTRECYVGSPDASARLLLIEAIGKGPYADALEKRGPGLHHVGIDVPDIDAFLKTLTGTGWHLHYRSFETRRTSNTVWLVQRGVGAMVEVHERAPALGKPFVEALTVRGLEDRAARLFDGAQIEVSCGSGNVRVGGSWMAGLASHEPRDLEQQR